MSEAVHALGDLALGAAKRAPMPAKTADRGAAKRAAAEFEGFFLARMLEQMFAGIRTDGPFGGGHAEAVFRSLMIDEFGKVVARAGGIGLADAIARTLLSAQESQSR